MCKIQHHEVGLKPVEFVPRLRGVGQASEVGKLGLAQRPFEGADVSLLIVNNENFAAQSCCSFGNKGFFMFLSGCSVFAIYRLSSFDPRWEILSGYILQSAGPRQQAPKWSRPSGVLRCLLNYFRSAAATLLSGKSISKAPNQFAMDDRGNTVCQKPILPDNKNHECAGNFD